MLDAEPRHAVHNLARNGQIAGKNDASLYFALKGSHFGAQALERFKGGDGPVQQLAPFRGDEHSFSVTVKQYGIQVFLQFLELVAQGGGAAVHELGRPPDAPCFRDIIEAAKPLDKISVQFLYHGISPFRMFQGLPGMSREAGRERSMFGYFEQ